MERRLGSTFYSNEDGCRYRVVRGGVNSCKGCCFVEWYDNGDSECNKPSDAGVCVADERYDGNDIIFKVV